MRKGDKVGALVRGQWITAAYEMPMTVRGREGQHMVKLEDGHAAIAAEVDEWIGKRFLPEHESSGFAYVEVVSRNKKGTYGYQPYYPNGKKGSAGAVLLQDLERWRSKRLEGVTVQ